MTVVWRWLRAGALLAVIARIAPIVSAAPALGRPRTASSAGGAAGTNPVHADPVAVTVVVPARDEADRIGTLLAALRRAPAVSEVVVVDDRSSDDTAGVARRAGARVVAGSEPPPGWAGKTWALHQGVGTAGTDWVVTLDADTVPDPELPLALVERARADRLALASAAGRFEIADPRARWLHAAMLAGLVARCGPPGTGGDLVNGQCLAARRADLLAGLEAVCGELVEDVALAQHVRRSGGRVALLDAVDLLTVRPYASVGTVWRGWGRSIGLRGRYSTWRQLVEVAVVALAWSVPPARVCARRADVVDALALAVRVGTVVGLRRAYVDRGAAVWASPLADPLALVATVAGLLDPAPTWRGRSFAGAG